MSTGVNKTISAINFNKEYIEPLAHYIKRKLTNIEIELLKKLISYLNVKSVEGLLAASIIDIDSIQINDENNLPPKVEITGNPFRSLLSNIIHKKIKDHPEGFDSGIRYIYKIIRNIVFQYALEKSSNDKEIYALRKIIMDTKVRYVGFKKETDLIEEYIKIIDAYLNKSKPNIIEYEKIQVWEAGAGSLEILYNEINDRFIDDTDIIIFFSHFLRNDPNPQINQIGNQHDFIYLFDQLAQYFSNKIIHTIKGQKRCDKWLAMHFVFNGKKISNKYIGTVRSNYSETDPPNLFMINQIIKKTGEEIYHKEKN